jgi:hypothetical protein
MELLDPGREGRVRAAAGDVLERALAGRRNETVGLVALDDEHGQLRAVERRVGTELRRLVAQPPDTPASETSWMWRASGSVHVTSANVRARGKVHPFARTFPSAIHRAISRRRTPNFAGKRAIRSPPPVWR